MRVFRSVTTHSTVVIFGRGLIGSAIERAMQRKSTWQFKSYSFPWDIGASRIREQRLAEAMADLRIMTRELTPDVHVIWSAGRAGFAATYDETNAELISFRQVVEFSEAVQIKLGVATHLHILSSAGGVFEGSRGINHQTPTSSIRPYGDLKLAQEAIAMMAKTVSRSILRPTSVYSTIQPGKRRGLIPTVIWNTLNNQTTTIYGNHNTLRDYIWADDIGSFQAERISGGAALEGQYEHFLATAVPTPISRIIRLIEDMLMRPVPVRFILPKNDNSLDITVASESLPKGLVKTDLATAIRLIYLRLLSEGMTTHG